MCHVIIGEGEILVPPLLAGPQQPAIVQFGQMRAGRLDRDTGLFGQFAHGQGLPAHQSGQHVRAGGIADQCGDIRNIRPFFHTSIVVEAFVPRNALACPKDIIERATMLTCVIRDYGMFDRAQAPSDGQKVHAA